MKTRIMIIGGTGRMGSALVAQLYGKVDAIGVFSRGVSKQQEMAVAFPDVDFHVGDITNLSDLRNAIRGFDTIIHCAAMKDVAQCESSIDACVGVNVNGTQNAIQAAVERGVERFVYISTDMAVESSSVYGHSKALADAVVIDAARSNNIRTCVVRLGNIIGSKGSIFDALSHKADLLGYVPITHPEMSRFMMSATHCAQYIISIALGEMTAGAIFVPLCPSYDILNVAKAVRPDCNVKIVGLRPGDVLSVVMISQVESPRTYYHHDQGYVIYPTWADKIIAGPCVEFDSLTSNNNQWRATVDELKEFYSEMKLNLVGHVSADQII